MPDIFLTADALVRAVSVNASSPHALFLGAGSSISSGVASAWRCTLEWKRDIFRTKNTTLQGEFSELSLSGVQERIQAWLDRNGYPEKVRQWAVKNSLDGPAESFEYGFFIEECYPVPGHRRQYFQNAVKAVKPYVGYKLVCLLAKANLIRSVWTTNFDGLMAKAAANYPVTPIEVSIDSQERLDRMPQLGELLCVALHGDYRYDLLKNTPPELQAQEMHLEQKFVDLAENTHLIVSGYSGRDKSIMDMFHRAYARKGAGALYWCGVGGGDPAPPVAALIGAARAAGRVAFFVPTNGFDELMVGLGLGCLTGEDQQRAQDLATEAMRSRRGERAAFQVESLPIGGLVKSNAFKVECPSDVLQFELDGLPAEGVWSWLREKTAGHPVEAVPTKGKILAFGTTDGIKELFGDAVRGTIDRSPVGGEELRFEDGPVSRLMLQTLLKCFEAELGVKSDGRRLIWDESRPQRRQFGDQQCSVYEAALLSLRRIRSNSYLVIKPTVALRDQNGDRLDKEAEKVFKQQILGWQHNNKFNDALMFWRNKLGSANAVQFEFPHKCGSTFRFKIHRTPVFANIGDPGRTSDVRIDPKYAGAIRQVGSLIGEPNLVFADRRSPGHTVADPHPIRGIVSNRPHDFPLTRTGFADSVSLGVVCPGPEVGEFSKFLASLTRLATPHNSERDYLLDYPGFQTAFGLPLTIPAPGDVGWVACPDPPPGSSAPDGAVEAGRLITGSIDQLYAACKPHLVVVCIPDRWANWRGFKAPEEKFDLHDFVKAYCVQRGICSQMLEQDTLRNAYQCRVLWWLSLAIYVKSKRTPWVLEELDADTAFVGLGFSIDDQAERGQHVILGCSHIYNPRGEGLQYRLTKLDNPIMRGRNPYMKAEDARRVGDGIRQLFYDAMGRLPKRVVLHKRTPFIRSEREGLLQGLADVNAIDMVQITIDDMMRYMASKAERAGAFRIDGYPVRRGTTVVLDDYSALLWCHGVTTALDPNLNYYQGKRRIPAPLVLTRHVGSTPLSVIGKEILGLSKMNWNTFDMYTKLPATIDTSNAIARIGPLLGRLSGVSYDYRLFM